MSDSILMGNLVTEAEVVQVPTVPFTRTFHPVHHKQVIDAVRAGISLTGMEVVQSRYVLARDGMQMFGVWDLNAGSPELCWSLGIRNSMDKSLALGITAGTKVFVCDNLAFEGEYITFRKHTSGLDNDELEFLAYKAMKNMVPRLVSFQKWHEGLKNYELTEQDAKILLVDVLTDSVFPASKFNSFNDLYFGGVYEPTLWGFHETVTDVLRGSNLITLPKKNRQLNNAINGFICDLEREAPSPLGDFYEQRYLNQN
jgi:hypothetical protein